MQQTTEPAYLPAYLIVQLGNRWTDVLRLQPEQMIVIGRASDCQVVVRDDRVSRHHAKILVKEGGWCVEDLGSRNGTQVDEQAIHGVQALSEGARVTVGGCHMTFTHQLTAGFARSGGSGDGVAVEHRQTREIDPTIVGRLERSRWSSAGIDSPFNTQRAASGGAVDAAEDGWSYFHRLVFDLIQCQSLESAAQTALDRLLERLGISSGGVLSIAAEAGAAAASEPPKLALLAARQGSASSYRRVSDFLVQTVVNDRQAVLARNVSDDSVLGIEQASGQRQVVSMICAPLRDPSLQSRVIGLLHVYTLGDERMLAEADLSIAVGVADHLSICLTRLGTEQRLAQDLQQTRRKLDQLEEQLRSGNEMVGGSGGIRAVQQAIERAAPTTATVLIRGESGVGKELVARAVHRLSKRHGGPFVCLNCAALAPTLLESELFGHEKGAFTGATERKIGKFEAADGGTLFLDEIGEMSQELQAKFLRVLEGQPFERLGGNKAIQTNVRVIAATNRDLEQAVTAKEFRSDLYFRLRVIEIIVPPLRQRPEDIPILVEYFIQSLKHHAGRRIVGIEPQALKLLCRYEWPGNVRELRNVIERAIVLGAKNTIDIEDLSLSPLSQSGAADDAGVVGPRGEVAAVAGAGEFEPISLAELERRHIASTLEFVGGNKSRAAQMLGIERSTLDRKLKRQDAGQ